MANTNINVRVDEKLKKDADSLFNDLGLTMSAAITMFLRSAVNNDGIPFEVKRVTPNAQTLQAMSDVREGVGLSQSFDSIADLMEDLNA